MQGARKREANEQGLDRECRCPDVRWDTHTRYGLEWKSMPDDKKRKIKREVTSESRSDSDGGI